jgi:hypothetical protein
VGTIRALRQVFVVEAASQPGEKAIRAVGRGFIPGNTINKINARFSH